MKRGQFYLIAALIIVLVFSGLNYVYLSIRAPTEKVIIYDLAKEINYEGKWIINYEIGLGKIDIEIVNELKDKLLDKFYSSRYPDISINLVYGTTDKSYIINKTGSSEATISDVGGKKMVEIDKRAVEIKPGIKNFYVLLMMEREGEKMIAVDPSN